MAVGKDYSVPPLPLISRYEVNNCLQFCFLTTFLLAQRIKIAGISTSFGIFSMFDTYYPHFRTPLHLSLGECTVPSSLVRPLATYSILPFLNAHCEQGHWYFLTCWYEREGGDTLFLELGSDFSIYRLLSLLYESLAEVAPVTDCLQLKALGVQAYGAYHLDFTGSRELSKAAPVYCYDGWTVILKRGAYGQNAPVDVSKQTRRI